MLWLARNYQWGEPENAVFVETRRRTQEQHRAAPMSTSRSSCKQGDFVDDKNVQYY
jgi:hypothetical protein